jgi:UDP-2,4-diacetamido-2,4,6-trideoxy-beta-L-altropyranose hydrolase
VNVVFRVDSATHIGGGHLMRCLALAEELRDRGVRVKFICRELAGNLISHLRKQEISVSVLTKNSTNSIKTSINDSNWLGVTQNNDAEDTIRALKNEKPEWLIVDHYGLDINWESTLRPYCGQMMVIDDLANRLHECDILLDQNYQLKKNTQRYNAIVPKKCKLILGSSYALLRKEFQILRQQSLLKPKLLKQLLVFFTTGDDRGETLKAMQGICLFDKVEKVDVVVGTANRDKIAIKKMCLDKKWEYHCQIDYMPKLIANNDLVIGASGSSNWERCALGIPAIVVILSEDQAAIAHSLESAGVVINMGWNTKVKAADYARVLANLTPKKIESLSINAASLVDTKGAQRVAKIITKIH